MFNLGIHGSHNATVAISYQGTVLEVVEIERLIARKNAALCFYENPPQAEQWLREVQHYFLNKYKADRYDYVVANSVDYSKINLQSIFPCSQVKGCGHHDAHAYSALYQSPYPKCLVISFDGGSDQKFFNVYIAEKFKELDHVYSGETDYAVSYMTAAHFIPAIKKETDIYKGNLTYAGKLMGYVGFGQVNPDMRQKLKDFYKSNKTDHVTLAVNNFVSRFSNYGISGWSSAFSEQDGKDIAITNQAVFEELFFEEISDFLSLYPTLPVILTGGCALNIINNTKLAREREVFIPPNPSDTGIAVGLVCSVIKPANVVDCTYAGPEVWDRMEMSKYLAERPYESLNIERIATLIKSAGILGVVRGRSEHGPRALGHRSILCDATNPAMKDTLNLKIKNREPFRPFSPIVRFEDLNKYFNWQKESRWMSFCPEVREEYRDLLRSVTHIDNTARVQTVTRDQNWFLYDLLTELDRQCGTGVVINTSFNVAGKPILNTYKEAFEVFDNTEMSALLLDDYLFTKS